MSEFLVHLGMLQWVQAEFSAIVVAAVSLKVLKCYSSVSLLACYSANFKPINSVHKFSIFWFILYFALMSAKLNEFLSCFPELWFLIICLLFRKPALALYFLCGAIMAHSSCRIVFSPPKVMRVLLMDLQFQNGVPEIYATLLSPNMTSRITAK